MSTSVDRATRGDAVGRHRDVPAVAGVDGVLDDDEILAAFPQGDDVVLALDATHGLTDPDGDELTVTIVGNGAVDNAPGNPYLYGETATLEPQPDPEIGRASCRERV